MEKLRYTTEYPDTQLVKMLGRHVVTIANLQAREADPKKDRLGGRQPRAKVAPAGPEQARQLARMVPEKLRTILDSEFAIVGISRSLTTRTRVTAEVFREELGLDLPIKRTRDLAEVHQGYRIFGGHQGRLRAEVVDDEYLARQEQEDWDFRYGDPRWNRFGAYVLSCAQTHREAGAHVLRWINEKPAVPEDVAASGLPLIDIGFGHGMSGTRGVGMALHGDPQNPEEIGISVAEAERLYRFPNASTIVLARGEEKRWAERGRIILPQA